MVRRNQQNGDRFTQAYFAFELNGYRVTSELHGLEWII